MQILPATLLQLATAMAPTSHAFHLNGQLNMIMTQFILRIAILIHIQIFVPWSIKHALTTTKIRLEKRFSAKVWPETMLIC